METNTVGEESRINFLQADSLSSMIIICNREYVSSLPNKILVLNEEYFWRTLQTYSSLRPFLSLNADDLAYNFYSSGSTVDLKGVRVEHTNVEKHLLNFQKKTGIAQNGKLAFVFTKLFRSFEIILVNSTHYILYESN